MKILFAHFHLEAEDRLWPVYFWAEIQHPICKTLYRQRSPHYNLTETKIMESLKKVGQVAMSLRKVAEDWQVTEKDLVSWQLAAVDILSFSCRVPEDISTVLMNRLLLVGEPELLTMCFCLFLRWPIKSCWSLNLLCLSSAPLCSSPQRTSSSMWPQWCVWLSKANRSLGSFTSRSLGILVCVLNQRPPFF